LHRLRVVALQNRVPEGLRAFGFFVADPTGAGLLIAGQAQMGK
jgi:hypothetical protein